MEDLPAATPTSPYGSYNAPSATCKSRERTDRGGVSCGDKYGVGDRHPARHIRNSRRWRTELQIARWNVRRGLEEKVNELLDVMDDRDLDVAYVTETKRKGYDTTDLPGCFLGRTRQRAELSRCRCVIVLSVGLLQGRENKNIFVSGVCASNLSSIRRT